MRYTMTLLASVVLGICSYAPAGEFYGWDQGTNNNSRLSSYGSAGDIATNVSLTNIGFAGSHIWDDIATDGTTFYGWDQGTNNNSRLSSYGSASDFATNTSLTNIGFSGSHIWDAIATDGTTFYGYDQSAGRLSSYPSAADIAANTNLTNIGFGGKTTFESIATDGQYFYGWDQGSSNDSVLYRYDSAANFASDTNAVAVGSTGSHIWDAVAAGAASGDAGPLTYKIDVNSGSSPTQAGWTALNANAGTGDGSSVVDQGVTFAILSADGHRDRGGPNDLARDFIFDDNGLVGLTFDNLPRGKYEGKVWAWDNDFPNLVNQSVLLRLPDNTFITFTDAMVPSATDPFTFEFDTSTFPAGNTLPGIFTSASRGRFNALQLTQVPEPATMALLGLAACGLGGYLRRRRSA